jgi:hypothetical protein
MLELNLSEDALWAIEKFTERQIKNAKAGGLKDMDWEESRSYAVEAMCRFLRDNPEVFRYSRDIDKHSYRNSGK